MLLPFPSLLLNTGLLICLPRPLVQESDASDSVQSTQGLPLPFATLYLPGPSRKVPSFLPRPHSHKHEELFVVSQRPKPLYTEVRYLACACVCVWGGVILSLGQPHLLSAMHPKTEAVTAPLTSTFQVFVPESILMVFVTYRSTIFFWAEESHQFYLLSEFDRLFSNPQPQTVPCYEKSQVSVIRQLNRVSHWGPDSKKTAHGLTGQESQDVNSVNSLCSSHHKAPCGAASLAYSRSAS